METFLQSINDRISAVVQMQITKETYDKINDERLKNRILALAKDMHVESSSTVKEEDGAHIYMCCVRTTADEPVKGSEFITEAENSAIAFMNNLSNIDFPEPEKECPSHEEAGEDGTLDFVKVLLEDINKPKSDECHVIGAQILCYGPKNFPFPVPWGKINHNLLKEFCELYIQNHKE